VVNGEFQPSITVRQGNILQARTPLSEHSCLSMTDNTAGRGTIFMRSAYDLVASLQWTPRKSSRVKLRVTPNCGARRCIMEPQSCAPLCYVLPRGGNSGHAYPLASRWSCTTSCRRTTPRPRPASPSTGTASAWCRPTTRRPGTTGRRTWPSARSRRATTSCTGSWSPRTQVLVGGYLRHADPCVGPHRPRIPPSFPASRVPWGVRHRARICDLAFVQDRVAAQMFGIACAYGAS